MANLRVTLRSRDFRGGVRGRKQDINCLMSVRKRVSGAYCEAMRARG